MATKTYSNVSVGEKVKRGHHVVLVYFFINIVQKRCKRKKYIPFVHKAVLGFSS